MNRLVNFCFAFILLFFLSPIIIIISLIIYLQLGFPILFKQQRAGLYGKPFYIYKFRTMTNEKDDKEQLLPDEKRITSVGRFLRKYSLDELPQLLNVIKGDMNFIGPRPLFMKYLSYYTPDQNRRHEVKPGITGWAQVHGRNAVSWEDKFTLDGWYVSNRSFMIDIKILLLTLVKVVRSEGIYKKGGGTMDEFTGSKNYGLNSNEKERNVLKIAIIGAGGFGKEVAQLIKDINQKGEQWELIGYFDDNRQLHGQMINDFLVKGSLSLLKNEIYDNLHVVCAIADPKIKRKIIETLKEINPTIKFPVLIHPFVVLGDENKIGEGSILCANSVVTTNVDIGKHTSIHISTTLSHDTIVEDYCTILPGATISGNVILNEGVMIGTKAAIIQGLEIGTYTTIGAGAVVTRSITGHCTAIGVPAQIIKHHDVRRDESG